MPHLEWFLIDALISLMIGVVTGIFLGARLTRSHYLHQTMMMQPPSQAPTPQPRHRPRTRHLPPYEEDYY